MYPNCTLLLNPQTKSDVLAACIQANAAVQAGLAQATASTQAGYWTFAAGFFAILAACLGVWMTHRQIAANRQEAIEQRRHALKSEAYFAATVALAEGLGVVVKIANLEIHGQAVFSDYTSSMKHLFGVHLVAEPPTLEKFLRCLESLGSMHRKLIASRPFNARGEYEREHLISWARECSAALSEVVPTMVHAVAAMRDELGLPLDPQEYERLINITLARAIAGNEQLFNELIKRWHEYGMQQQYR